MTQKSYETYYVSSRNKKPQGCGGFVLLFILLAFAIGCYNVKTAVKQTTKAHDNYEDTVSALLSKWYPPSPPHTVHLPPTIITKKVIDTTKQKALKKTIDSLIDNSNALNGLLDSCPVKINIDSLKEAITDNVLRGCGTFDETDTIQHDIVYQHDPQDSVHNKVLQNQLQDLNNKLIAAITQGNIYKSERNESITWLAVVVGLLGIGIFLKIKKII